MVCQDPVEYARTIDDLLTHPDKARELGRTARTAIQSSFAWEAHARTLEEILTSTM